MTVREVTDTPALDQLREGRRSSTIEEFLDWLDGRGLTIGQHDPVLGNTIEIRRSPEQWLCEFLGIDPVQLVAERCARRTVSMVA
jgi:hypothetical protein